MDKRKINLIQENLDKNEILLVLNNYNLFYLTGINLDGYSLAISKNKIKILTSLMIFGQVKKFFKDIEIVVGSDLEQQISKLNFVNKILLIDDKNLSLKIYDLLKKCSKIIKFSSLIENFRMIKSKNEIDKIKKSVEICKKVLNKTKEFIKPQITEVEVKNFILKQFLDYKVETAFPPIVAFDENTSYPHHISTNKRFKKNSLVLIDLGCKYRGYCCDITRMFNVEKNTKVKDLYIKLKDLQRILISMCKPSVKVKDIDNYARNYFKKLNLEKNYLHSTGHGLGLEIHELPKITIKNDVVLQENMVVTIEPGIYFNRKFGLRIEDDIVVNYETEILT
ncbi:MAG: M24 family metallopeptidase [Endomicrobiia bacterium]